MKAPACPCQSGLTYDRCCGPVHAQPAAAADALALMRSRYSAYVMNLPAHLLATWHPAHRPDTLTLDPDDQAWVGLTIKAHLPSGPLKALVHFVARRKTNGRVTRMEELSRFERVGHQWFYCDGVSPGRR